MSSYCIFADKECDLDLEEAYEQGRADAIDKIMQYTYEMLSTEKFGLQMYLKQLKEQKNERMERLQSNGR